MADKYRMTLSAGHFLGDENAIIEAGDLAGIPDNINGRICFKLADGVNQHAIVSISFSILDANIWTSGSGLKLKVHYFGNAAGGGNSIVLDGAVEAISESDAHDMHATGDFFAAHQSVTDVVDANAGELNVAEITFNQAQADALEPEDHCRIAMRRDSNDGSDDYADSIWVDHVDVYEVTV